MSAGTATDESTDAIAREAGVLVGWNEAEVPCMKLLPGGATGRTFALSRRGEEPSFCVRVLRAAGADEHLEKVSVELARAGISPRVIASTPRFVITELISGTTLSVPALADCSKPECTLAAQAIAKLHRLPADEVCGPRKPAGGGDADPAAMRDEGDLVLWLSRAAECVGTHAREASASVSTLVEGLRTEVDAARARSLPLTGLAGRLSCSHGDFHPGNVVVSRALDGAWLVDLEHVGSRPAAYDIGYFFAVWGDMQYLAGWTPSPTHPTPYPSLSSRRRFAAAYMEPLQGDASPPPAADADVDDLLLQVERYAHYTRTRYSLIWLVLARGDPAHMLVQAANAYLPYLQQARALLARLDAGDITLRDEVLQDGLITVAARTLAQAGSGA